VSNHGGGESHRRRPRVEFRPLHRPGLRVESSGSFLAAMRICRGPWPGLGCGGATGPQRSRGRRAAEQGGCGAGASVAVAGISVRVQRGLGLLFVGRRGTLGVRAQGGARRRFREGRCAPGRKGKGEEEADARALAGRGREGEERGAAWLRRKWAGRGPCGKKDRWASGSTWPKEKRERRGNRRAGLGVVGPRGEKRGEGRGPAQEILGCFLCSSLLFFFFPTLKLFKHNYLNSNKFEFKPYNSTQGKQCFSMNAQTC
jgi:hypothetical protein